jgi:hypothetical protein
MKTNIKSLIILCTLGLVGAFNASAAISYNASGVAEIREEQNLRFETLNLADFVFNTDASVGIDYQKEASMVIQWVADREEAKALQMLIDNLTVVSNEETASLFVEESDSLNSGEFVYNEDTVIDYQKEARLLIKLIADNEEAKVVQQFIGE